MFRISRITGDVGARASSNVTEGKAKGKGDGERVSGRAEQRNHESDLATD